MRKGMVLLTGFLLAFSIFLTGCETANNDTKKSDSNTSSKDESAFINISSEVFTSDDDGSITISGMSNSNAKIYLTSLSDASGETTADKDGKFTINTNIQDDSEATLIATKDKETTEKSIKLYLNDSAKSNSDKKRKEKEEKSANEEKELQIQKNQDAKDNAKSISYQMLNKNADTYIDEPYYIKGKVVQAIEDSGTTLMRVNVTEDENGYYDDTMAVLYDSYTDAVEDDIIEVYGTIYGNYTYETTIGGEMRVPGLNAETINILK
ncbi:TPA_asm: hypothetical protein GEQ36_14485 [Listeria monocytogenes]|uniref:hypothetical protein n=1 Tax=Listeria TaxID=1637 RepID=UPI000D72ADC4|nr:MULTISPECIES: hypothetical protein [Listeria]EAF1397330.1 hypothetical protein [Listeria monocytogenes]EAF1680005.1 hypothetical protein [Listeria monocytogenes]EAG7150218.1 hypothetical protein [Listeria monocytogenes]EAW7161208.1 hypothetical protein [Listeria monocytogenes]EAW7227543.1 hypothetical protein [Listeria monocytogenes]